MYFIFLRVLSKKICWKWVIWFIKSIGEFMLSFLLLKLPDSKQVNETSFSLTNNALSMLFFVQKKINSDQHVIHPFIIIIIIIIILLLLLLLKYNRVSELLIFILLHSLLLKRKTLWSKWVDMAEAHMTGPLKTASTGHVANWFLLFFCSLLFFFCSYFFFNFILQYRVFI